MPLLTGLFIAQVVLGSFMIGSLVAGDWPGFRGSSGGVANDVKLPDKWTKDDIRLKIKLPGPGTSSPITYGNKIYLTCYTGYGTTISKGFSGGGFGGKKGGGGADTGGDQKKLMLHLLCLDATKGEIEWQKDIKPKLPEAAFSGFLREHGYASSTPVTDGERIYVFFGKSGVHAFDMKGEPQWQADVGSSTDKWGSAASPVLYNNLVIVNAAIESGSLVALDKASGKEKWRTRGLGKTWTSPLIVETKDGGSDLVLSLSGKIVGYDPDTGKERWHCQGIGSEEGYGYTASTPVARDGIVYVIGGGGPTAQATAIAVKTGGRGDVTKTHVLWRQKAGANTCSPVLSGDQLCWVSGSANCLNLADGKVVYNERLYGGKGEYVSAVVAGDKIFALTRLDGLYVLDGGQKFQTVSHFDFEGDKSIFNASPALSHDRIYIRSNEYLYAVGKGAK